MGVGGKTNVEPYANYTIIVLNCLLGSEPNKAWSSTSAFGPIPDIGHAELLVRGVPDSEVVTTRLLGSNWSSGRSYLCNGDAGDREQPTDNQLWGHTVAKEQHARNQGEHRKQQAEWR